VDGPISRPRRTVGCSRHRHQCRFASVRGAIDWRDEVDAACARTPPAPDRMSVLDREAPEVQSPRSVCGPLRRAVALLPQPYPWAGGSPAYLGLFAPSREGVHLPETEHVSDSGAMSHPLRCLHPTARCRRARTGVLGPPGGSHTSGGHAARDRQRRSPCRHTAPR
jgi:hypothetical protein